MSKKGHQQREGFKVAIFKIETLGFLQRSSFVLQIDFLSFLATYAYGRGRIYISLLINQLEVFKAQNAFKEKENRVTYLPFFPQRSNRGCSQGCLRTQANLMR